MGRKVCENPYIFAKWTLVEIKKDNDNSYVLPLSNEYNWCTDEIEGRWCVVSKSTWETHYIKFYFKNKQDAIMFKIIWS